MEIHHHAQKGSKDTVKPVYDGHLCFHLKVDHFTPVAKLRKPLDTTKTELCNITCSTAQFRVQRQ